MIPTHGTLQAKLFWAFALVTVIAAALPAFYSRGNLRHEHRDMAGRQALAQAALIKGILESGASERQIGSMLASVKEIGARMTIADKNGIVIHDSQLDAEAMLQMDNHSDRPEVEAAHRDGRGISLRHSNTLGIDAVFAAVALADGGFLRLAVPLSDIDRDLQKEISALSLTVICAAAFCLLLSIFITRRIRGSVDEMAEAVGVMAKNEGGRRLAKVPGREFLPLALAVNAMAENMEKYVATTTEQQTQLEVILDSVHEGILVLGPGGSIRRYNRAIEALFPHIGEALGGPLIEGIPFPELQRRVDELFKGQMQEKNPDRHDDAVHFELGGRFLVAHLSRPVDMNRSLGAVIVIYDATHIMRLERTRRDFVTNISHELRTPLTAITGYAETLMGLDELDSVHRNFAGIIHKHAQALARVVSELLALARIDDTRERVRLSPIDPDESINEALRLCAEQAGQKDLRFVVNIATDVTVMGSAPLLTQVFRNLLENACRYSPDNGEIAVSGEARENEVLFSVKDSGSGIPKEELGRIFERLYQVKKQRNSGSSGIGLAIVKHIVERHGGKVWAESPYQGFATAMLFTLPAAGKMRPDEGQV